ncbi:MAG: hypothetical protein RL516_584, partial [Bacteroidota bacterium]
IKIDQNQNLLDLNIFIASVKLIKHLVSQKVIDIFRYLARGNKTYSFYLSPDL